MTRGLRALLWGTSALYGADAGLQVVSPWLGPSVWIGVLHSLTIGTATAWLCSAWMFFKLREAIE